MGQAHRASGYVPAPRRNRPARFVPRDHRVAVTDDARRHPDGAGSGLRAQALRIAGTGFGRDRDHRVPGAPWRRPVEPGGAGARVIFALAGTAVAVYRWPLMRPACASTARSSTPPGSFEPSIAPQRETTRGAGPADLDTRSFFDSVGWHRLRGLPGRGCVPERVRCVRSRGRFGVRFQRMPSRRSGAVRGPDEEDHR